VISPEMLENVLQIALIGAGKGSESYFNWSFFFQHVANLIILLLALAYVLKRPLNNFLVERRGLIAREIDEAREKMEAAREKFEMYSERLKGIDQEIKAMGEEIRREAEQERKNILESADITAERVKQDVEETIRLESERARQEIQDEAVAIAVGLAEKTIRESIGEDDEKRLLDRFIKVTEDEKWHQ